MNRKMWIGFALVLALLVGGRALLGVVRRPDDQTLIRAALKESVEASKEGRPGGVLDLLSDSIKVNDQAVGADRRQIAQFIRERKPDFLVRNDRALVTGDSARIVSPVDLKLELLGLKVERSIPEVTLVFAREDGRGFLFLPESKWRLTEVRVPDSAITDLVMQ